MKTTVEIADDLFSRTREVAQREGTTLRHLIEEGLRLTLAQREHQTTIYRWPDLSAGGEGLAPEIEEGNWEPLRDRIYAGRGA
ncbi:MAG TPA: DUF2191 domain-containing protein [Thermoanaerobaculia bacterium]